MALIDIGNGEGGQFLPRLAYNAKAGKLFKVDRVQGADGWTSVETDLTMTQPTFAADMGSIQVGWIYYSKQGMQSALVPAGHPRPPKPASPGQTDDGKAASFKAGFKLLVAGKAIGGLREISGNSIAIVKGMNALHADFEAAPEAAAGKIPVIKMTRTVAEKSEFGTNYAPQFDIVAWVDRPADLFGPRTVPAPIQTVISYGPDPKPAVAVTPAAAAPAPTGGSAGAMLDDDIPFSPEMR